MNKIKLHLVLLFEIFIYISCCGPGATYMIVSEIIHKYKNRGFVPVIDLSAPIDTLSLNKIANDDIKIKILEVIDIIEKYFKEDSALINDKIYLEGVLLKIGRNQGTKKRCLISYCIISDYLFAFSAAIVSFGAADATPSYRSYMLITLGLLTVSYIGGDLLIKRWHDKLVINQTEIIEINEIIHMLNSKIKNIDEEEK